MRLSSSKPDDRPTVRVSPRLRTLAAATGTIAVLLLLACPLLLAVPAGKTAPAPAATVAPAPRFTRSLTRVEVPDLFAVDQDGRSVSLSGVLDRREPVVVSFFFASCGSICPVMTATLAAMREELARDGRTVRTVSITVDPEQDTPDVLKSYSRRFSAGPGWSFLTAQPATTLAILKAFGAESGGKFNHRPLYFFRAARSDSWVRIEGLAGASDLAAEARVALRGAVAGR